MTDTSSNRNSKYAIHMPGAQNVQIGDGNTQFNDFQPARSKAAESDSASPLKRSPWRVFISHTGELEQYPADRSFVAAAKIAIERAGHASVEMNTWTAAPHTPREVCESRVRGCDVYVGIFGFCWGSPVRGEPDRSYTELEFDTAADADLPRLAFVVSDKADVTVPRTFWVDEHYGDRQAAFRKRIDDSGITRVALNNPGELEALLYQALTELATGQ